MLTFRVEDLYREAEAIRCPDVTDDDVEIFGLQRGRLALFGLLDDLFGLFVEVFPYLEKCQIAEMMCDSGEPHVASCAFGFSLQYDHQLQNMYRR